jgi:peptidyl-prolyl cis-trans isomerase D
MVNLLRKHQQFLMILVTIVVIIAFAWLYNTTRFEKIGAGMVATVYGQGVSQGDIDRYARKMQLAYELGLFDLLRSTGAMDRERGLEDFVFNSIVLQHEAKVLQIQPVEDDVYQEVKTLPIFQTNGAFDPARYGAFVQTALGPRGFTEAHLEDLVRENLRLKRLRELLAATVEVSPTEFRAAYEQQTRKVEISVVRLQRADFLAGAQATDEEVARLFEQRKAAFKTEEKRQARFVKFELPEDQAKLEGKARMEALQKLADVAQGFAQAMLEKDADFAKVAEARGAKIEQTGEFTQAKPDPLLAAAPEVVGTIFLLTPDQPNSDVIAQRTSFYVVQLQRVEPGRPQTLDEVKPQLVEEVRNMRAQEWLNARGAELRGKLEEQMKGGKTFADAATAAGVQAEKLPAFSPAEPLTDNRPENGNIMSAAMDLAEGELGPFLPVGEGGVLIHVEKRYPIDEAKLAQDAPAMQEAFSRYRQEMVFREWLRLRRDAAKIQGSRG